MASPSPSPQQPHSTGMGAMAPPPPPQQARKKAFAVGPAKSKQQFRKASQHNPSPSPDVPNHWPPTVAQPPLGYGQPSPFGVAPSPSAFNAADGWKQIYNDNGREYIFLRDDDDEPATYLKLLGTDLYTFDNKHQHEAQTRKSGKFLNVMNGTLIRTRAVAPVPRFTVTDPDEQVLIGRIAALQAQAAALQQQQEPVVAKRFKHV